MTPEQHIAWERLKSTGNYVNLVQIIADGYSVGFTNHLFITGYGIVRLLVDGVLQEPLADYRVQGNTIMFYEPPEYGAEILVQIKRT